MRRIVLCFAEGVSPVDPGRGETAKRDVEVAYEWDDTPAGGVGFAEGEWRALELAAEHGDDVDRLALVSTAPPGREVDLDAVTAKTTLLLYGADDPDGGPAHGKWWRDALGARLEIVADGGRDILERVLPRVLSNLAPHTLRN